MKGNYKEALIDTFLLMDTLLWSEDGISEIMEITDEVREMEGKEPLQPGDEELIDCDALAKGCTANVLLIKNKKLYAANAGDSRSIAISKDSKTINLSCDHKPDNDEELARIRKAGGKVVKGRVEGMLNLSRALGDLKFKSNGKLRPEQQMVTAYPGISIKEITSDLFYVVMGCDGIYETKSSKQVGSFVCNTIKNDPTAKLTEIGAQLMDSTISPDFRKTAGVGCDNMTCILIKFKH